MFSPFEGRPKGHFSLFYPLEGHPKPDRAFQRIPRCSSVGGILTLQANMEEKFYMMSEDELNSSSFLFSQKWNMYVFKVQLYY